MIHAQPNKAAMHAVGLALTLAAGVPSALAYSPSHGVKATVGVAPQAPTCGAYVNLELKVRNIDSALMDIHSVLTLPVVHLSHDGSVAPSTTPTRLSFGQGFSLPALDVQPGGVVSLPLVLDKPQQDGYFEERLRVDWEYDANATKVDGINKVKAAVYYRVDQGCVTVIDPQAYYQATDVVASHTAFLDGQVISVNDIEGYADYGAPSPGAEVDAEPLLVVDDNNVSLYDDDLLQQRRPDLLADRLELEEVERTATTTTLQYCVKVRYVDDFTSCPIDTTGMKWWQPYCDGNKTSMMGLVVELWDYDTSSADDLIGTYALNYTARDQYTCATFEWNSTTRGETWPDPYIKTYYKVKDVEYNSGEWAYLCESDQSSSRDTCDDFYTYTWRSSYVSNQSGTVYESKNFGNDVNIWNRRAMSMAGVQKFLRGFQTYNMTGNLNVWWNGDECTDSGGDPWPCSYDDNWFTMADQTYQRWDIGPHEAGHCYQKQLFEQTWLSGSSCGSPHFIDTAYNDACATKEGWAGFVATLTWFTDSASKSTALPVYLGERVEDGSKEYGACSDNAKTEIQVTRALWDLYDSRADGVDTASVVQDRYSIAYTWDAFANGTSNHKDKEGGDNGVNMQDFHYNASWSGAFQNDVMDAMEQNDIDCQDTN